MKARPILFSAPMVRALLEGRKTQTRRLIKGIPKRSLEHDKRWYANVLPPSGSLPDEWSWWDGPPHGQSIYHLWKCPYGIPGDLLWVRETFAHTTNFPPAVRYYATDDVHELRKKRPAIHMPRWASRLTLEITDVRVERLQDISDADAAAEGIAEVHQGWLGSTVRTSAWCRRSREIQAQRGVVRDCADDVGAYSLLWEDLNGAGSWDTNPWIVALTFKVHKAHVDAVLEQCKEVAA